MAQGSSNSSNRITEEKKLSYCSSLSSKPTWHNMRVGVTFLSHSSNTPKQNNNNKKHHPQLGWMRYIFLLLPLLCRYCCCCCCALYEQSIMICLCIYLHWNMSSSCDVGLLSNCMYDTRWLWCKCMVAAHTRRHSTNVWFALNQWRKNVCFTLCVRVPWWLLLEYTFMLRFV